jgi:hypothetical protein
MPRPDSSPHPAMAGPEPRGGRRARSPATGTHNPATRGTAARGAPGQRTRLDARASGALTRRQGRRVPMFWVTPPGRPDPRSRPPRTRASPRAPLSWPRPDAIAGKANLLDRPPTAPAPLLPAPADDYSDELRDPADRRAAGSIR